MVGGCGRGVGGGELGRDGERVKAEIAFAAGEHGGGEGSEIAGGRINGDGVVFGNVGGENSVGGAGAVGEIEINGGVGSE